MLRREALVVQRELHRLRNRRFVFDDEYADTFQYMPVLIVQPIPRDYLTRRFAEQI